MRQVVLAVPLAAVLALATTPIAFADGPSLVDIVLPGDTTLCVGEERLPATNFTFAVERSSTGPQLSNGATLRLSVPFDQPAIEREIGIYQFNTSGEISVTLPDDWTSLPEGTLSDGVEYRLSLLGEGPGVLPNSTITWVIEVVTPEPQLHEFPGTLDGFEVVDCTATPRPTVPPTDTATTPTRGADESAIALMLVALAATALLLESVRRRPT